MFKIFGRKNQKTEKYVIAICTENNISTKVGEVNLPFDTYEDAKHFIFSKACGWGNNIVSRNGDNANVGDAWLIIEKK